MSRRERPPVTIVVDGTEIVAPEGTMLVDAAKRGDVEIPVFCYEPKLGAPVGACRMCLVEIEGIPKLQASCATPVRDGMVVYTRSEGVREAQSAVVEFLLVNHPLDCPVCDKGGECPLQDISVGWGEGKSRVSDPKRHFEKPVPLSPLVRIDRERCILCYRCVRFSQEVSEDEQLQLIQRGSNSYVGTHDNRPYNDPFHGNITELCPVGALTSETYRFRARPWDIEDAGSVCTFCPSQCNVKFTVRDERVARVMSRQNDAVDDGWLCDKGRYGFQMFGSSDRPTTPLIRSGGALGEASWDEALTRIAAGLKAARGKVGVIVGGGTSNEEGYLLQRIARGALDSPHIDSRPGGTLPRALHAALADPAISATISDLDSANAICVIGCDPLNQMPMVDLRIRKAVRRNGAVLSVASERPSTLDGGTAPDRHQAASAVRYAPGDGATLIADLRAAIAGAENRASAIAAGLLGRDDVVIVWGERLGFGPDGEAAIRSLLGLADDLGLAAKPSSGLLEVPGIANARGLREAGCLPTAGPGLTETATGMNAAEIRDALEAGDLRALILWNVDPVRDFPEPTTWARAIGAAEFTLSVSMFGTASAQNADVHLPAETHAEADGTVTHPDGRIQRLRPNLAHPGSVRAHWQVLSELAARLGDETGFDSAADVLGGLAAAAPIYAGLTQDEIGGGGVRWQERDAAIALAIDRDQAPPPPTAAPAGNGSASAGGGTGALRLGTYRDLWVGEISERSAALGYLTPTQRLEIGAADADRLGIGDGDRVLVGDGKVSVQATVAVRRRMLEGTAFLLEGTAEQSATPLIGSSTVTVERIPAAATAMAAG